MGIQWDIDYIELTNNMKRNDINPYYSNNPVLRHHGRKLETTYLGPYNGGVECKRGIGLMNMYNT